MQREVWDPTYEEKEALFLIYLMGWEEAEQGLPLRRGHNLDTLSQKHYREGWTAKHAEILLKVILPDD